LNGTGAIEVFNVKKWQENLTPSIVIYSNPALKTNALTLISVVKNGDRLGFVFTDRAILARVNSGTLFFPFNEFSIQKEDPISKS
jgi:hypothetical protein